MPDDTQLRGGTAMAAARPPVPPPVQRPLTRPALTVTELIANLCRSSAQPGACACCAPGQPPLAPLLLDLMIASTGHRR